MSHAADRDGVKRIDISNHSVLSVGEKKGASAWATPCHHAMMTATDRDCSAGSFQSPRFPAFRVSDSNSAVRSLTISPEAIVRSRSRSKGRLSHARSGAQLPHV